MTTSEDATRPPIDRAAGRILLLDPDGRVLLLEHRLAPEGTETVWAAPGGGCEPGETPAEAAVRELAEECGIRVDAAAEAVHVERRRWYLGDSAYDQTDHYFLVRVTSRPAVSADARTELEAHMVLGSRWFSVADLARSVTRFEPAALIDILDRVR